MLSLPPTVRVFVAVEPLDMRGSFDALAGAVRRLGLDPVDGHLYLFLNRRRHLAKALWFDGSGWCVLAKRLEAGSFQLPPLTGEERQVQVDGLTSLSQLAAFLSDGSDAVDGPFASPNERAPRTTVFGAVADDLPQVSALGCGRCRWARCSTSRGSRPPATSSGPRRWWSGARAPPGSSPLSRSGTCCSAGPGLTEPDVWESEILRTLDALRPEMEDHRYPTLEVIMRAVDADAMPGYFGGDIGCAVPDNQKRFATILRKHGYDRCRVRVGGQRTVLWMPKETCQIAGGPRGQLAAPRKGAG